MPVILCTAFVPSETLGCGKLLILSDRYRFARDIELGVPRLGVPRPGAVWDLGGVSNIGEASKMGGLAGIGGVSKAGILAACWGFWIASERLILEPVRRRPKPPPPPLLPLLLLLPEALLWASFARFTLLPKSDPLRPPMLNWDRVFLSPPELAGGEICLALGSAPESGEAEWPSMLFRSIVDAECKLFRDTVLRSPVFGIAGGGSFSRFSLEKDRLSPAWGILGSPEFESKDILSRSGGKSLIRLL